jgi:VanZ family protein
MRALAALRRFGPALLMMGLIYYASDTPGPDLPHFGLVDLFMKKGGHVVGYALLGLAYLHALAPRGTARPAAAALAIALGTAYGALDELHQGSTPGRRPSGADVAVDTVGAGLGVAVRMLRQAGRRASPGGAGPD